MSSLSTKIRSTARYYSPAAMFDRAVARTPEMPGEVSNLDRADGMSWAALERPISLVQQALDSIDSRRAYGPLDGRAETSTVRPFSLPAPRDIWSDDPDRTTRRGDTSTL